MGCRDEHFFNFVPINWKVLLEYLLCPEQWETLKIAWPSSCPQGASNLERERRHKSTGNLQRSMMRGECVIAEERS